MRLRDLLEQSNAPLRGDIKHTLPPTMIIPELINSDAYKQYRYNVALASARAEKNNEVEFDMQSAWNESLTAIAYTPEELETIELANKLMGVQGVMISNTQSQEPTQTNTVSPVAKFNMTEGMRQLLDKLTG